MQLTALSHDYVNIDRSKKVKMPMSHFVWTVAQQLSHIAALINKVH